MTGVLLAVAAVAGCSSPATHPKPLHSSAGPDRPRPNFVFVLTDDLSWDLVSRSGTVTGWPGAGWPRAGWGRAA